MSNVKPYTLVSQFYDQLMNGIDYVNWADYVNELLSPFVKKRAPILEIAAGKGALAAHLKYFYPNIVISDLSFEMIHSLHATKLQRLVCSFEALPFRPRFDAVLCLFDSINYALTTKHVRQVFREVHSVLKPGGIFVFDCCLEYGSKRHADIKRKPQTYGSLQYSQKSEYNALTGIHKNTFNIVSLTDGATTKEIHKQKIYPIETFFQLLTIEKFSILECFKNFTFEDYDQKAGRAQFLVRKN